MRKLWVAAAFAALLVMGACWPVSAKTFRFANDGDVNSMDPYARNETFLLTFMGNIDEPLIRRGKSLELQPAPLVGLHWIGRP
jgi:peptide/nickel transport system substrate-binding protein